MIYKQFIALPEAWSETRRLGEAETKVADAAIRLAPVIFHRHVAAVADLRVTIIGDELFAAAVDVRDLAYDVDMRLNPARNTSPTTCRIMSQVCCAR